MTLIYSLLGHWSRYLVALDGIIARNREMSQELRLVVSEDVPHVNQESLVETTHLMEEVGFQFLGDIASRITYGESARGPFSSPLPSPGRTKSAPPPAPVETTGFVRAFVHPGHGCTASLMSVLITTKKTGKSRKVAVISIDSYAGIEDTSWKYSTGNSEANAFAKLLRHPRRLATRLSRDMAPSEILRVHLERRAAIAAAGGFAWDRNPTLETVFRSESRTVRHIRALFGGLTPLGAAWKLSRLKRDTSTEWLGDLAGRV